MYSQSKARSGRHKNRQRQSGEFQQVTLPQCRGQDDISQVTQVADHPPVSSPYQQPCKVLKETVFSSEIHSIEYNSPMASVASLSSGSSNDSPKVSSRHHQEQVCLFTFFKLTNFTKYLTPIQLRA